MTLWEFALAYDNGVSTNQIVIAAGPNEAAAAAGAMTTLSLPSGVALVRPGVMPTPDAEARWRWLCAPDAFPLVVSAAGRTAIFARGKGSVS
jgi:hypothetical protein